MCMCFCMCKCLCECMSNMCGCPWRPEEGPDLLGTWVSQPLVWVLYSSSSSPAPHSYHSSSMSKNNSSVISANVLKRLAQHSEKGCVGVLTARNWWDSPKEPQFGAAESHGKRKLKWQLIMGAQSQGSDNPRVKRGRKKGGAEDGWQPTLTMTSPQCREPHQSPGGQELKAGRGSHRGNNRFDKKKKYLTEVEV